MARDRSLAPIPRPQRERFGHVEGFTLLELLVAMALAAVLVGMITAVSTNAQKLYNETASRVEVAQKARYVLTDIRDHLQNMVVTSDLEYFFDQAAGTRDLNNHWDEGEELKDEAAGPNLEGGRPGLYDEAAHIIERQYTVDDFGLETLHDDYSIYFKGPTTVPGEEGSELRLANIEYYLADPAALDRGELGRVSGTLEVGDETKLVLAKVVRWIDTSKSTFQNREVKTKRKIYTICTNVTDFKVEYFFDNLSDNRAGQYLSPSDEIAGGEFGRTEQRPIRLSDGGVLKEFMYGGFKRISLRGQMEPGRRDSEKGELTQPYFRGGGENVGSDRLVFSNLAYGDQIYIWSDSQNSRVAAGDYTFERRESDRIYFREAIDTTEWTGSQNGLRYKAGYLPSGFRITVRILNDKGREPRTQSMIVTPLRKRA